MNTPTVELGDDLLNDFLEIGRRVLYQTRRVLVAESYYEA